MQHECTQAGKVDHIEQTLYQGNGKPAMTVQLAVIDEKLNLLKTEIDNIKSYGKAIIIAVLFSFGATLWQMVQKHNYETYKVADKRAEVNPWTK